MMPLVMKFRIVPVLLGLAAPFGAHAQTPPLINYQGRVAVGDPAVNFDGSGLFKFALVNHDGTVTFWSNDGTSAAGSEPAAVVTLPVARGLYSALLGDTALVNMLGIDPSVFSNPDVRLRVWFDDGINGSQLLAPDQRIAPAAYLADGAVTGANIAAASIHASHIAPASLDFSLLTVPADPEAGQVLGFDGGSFTWQSGVGDSVWSLSGANAFRPTGRVGIGTSTPLTPLDVRGDLTLDSGASPALYTGTGGAELNRFLALVNSPSSPSASGLKAGGILVADSYSYANPSKNNLVVKGSVGIGTPTPGARLTVQTPALSGITTGYGIEHTNGTVRLTSFIDGGAGWIGTRSNHPLNLFVNDGLPSMTITSNDVSMSPIGSAGTVTFGTPNAENGMTIARGNNRADLRFDGATFKMVVGPSGGPPSSLGGVVVSAAGNVGIGTTSPQAKLHVIGTIRTSVLTITGGADLAEPFPMSHGGIAAGTVVSIDPEHPGKLRRSAAAYDRKVAGIVSGANGIKPGISMIDEQQLEPGENVALSGRVYVKANASAGAIAPGDLLTTSDVPGEAMKAADARRAQGSILGKAMTPLDETTGMLLVLVTLQ